MPRSTIIVADELAAFMNVGWPGENWYLTDHAEYLWEQTFTSGGPGHIYEARQPGQLIRLADFEAAVRWQGAGPDPTGGVGHKLSELFLAWKRHHASVVVVAFVPRGREAKVRQWLAAAGCDVVETKSPATGADLPSRPPPGPPHDASRFPARYGRRGHPTPRKSVVTLA